MRNFPKYVCIFSFFYYYYSWGNFLRHEYRLLCAGPVNEKWLYRLTLAVTVKANLANLTDCWTFLTKNDGNMMNMDSLQQKIRKQFLYDRWKKKGGGVLSSFLRHIYKKLFFLKIWMTLHDLSEVIFEQWFKQCLCYLNSCKRNFSLHC